MLPFLLIYKGGILLYPIYSTENFVNSDKYLRYDDFSKEGLSYIDEDKNITVHESCVNLSQEDHSQYIPFEMERYYHGIDLMEMRLQIYFVNSQMGANFSEPINVSYSDYRIRFGWLVDRNATAVSGTLMFEIRAIGTVPYEDGKQNAEKDLQYVWKSNSNSQITIRKSLAGETTFTPTEDWYAKLMANVNKQINETMEYKQDAADSASEAAGYKNEAAGLVEEVKDSVETLNRSADEAEASANYAAESAVLAQSWAEGGTNTRVGENGNNARYWSEAAQNAVQNLQNTVNNNTLNLTNEIARATAKEDSLSDRIDSERHRSIEAESILTDSINAEVTRASGAELTLSTNLETVNRDLTTEVNRALAAEKELSDRFDEIESGVDQAITGINGKLAEKASTDSVNASVNMLVNALSNKADKSDIEELRAEIGTGSGNNAQVPTALKNPYAMIINGTTYDGSAVVDFTSIINALIDAKINNTPTYTITYNLANVTSSNVSASIIEGSAFDARLTADDGYEIPQDIEITMAGEDISEDAVVAGDQKSVDIRIPSVTGDVVITATGISSTDEPTDEPEEETGTYSVTYNLTNVTSTNTATTASKTYITTLNCVNSEKGISSIKITMGEEDITDLSGVRKTLSSSSEQITISPVTGNIVITAKQSTSTNN